MINTRVEAAGLLARLNRLETAALAPVRAVVKANAEAMKDEIRALVGKTAGSSRGGKGGKGKGVAGSRSGQPPRKRTGNLQQSVRVKSSKRSKAAAAGLALYVTVDADDGRGNRYPFMLESGTNHIGKRPFVKKAQRKIKKVFVRELTAAVKKAIQ